ncbi:cation:proton antiporter family protein [Caldalkalibacillus salinus]|uniref:cation:proton antiporter family protein n=1 Tax=Caldalkalibacillus salinus TaxID=2803787 RepID=UPI0019243366|nr:cation:proton antiporter family protein [Caldalkalibacillus salinus]
MEEQSILSLMIVVTIAFMVPILLHRLKLDFIPVVVAEIIAGIIIGKSGFNIISEDPWLDLLSLLGLIFLMFLSGVEIDFRALRSSGGNGKQDKNKAYNPFVASTAVFIGIFILGFVLSLGLQAFGLIDNPFLMTLIISTISLGVVLPVLKERKLTETAYGQTILLIAIISDVATMVLLAGYIMYVDQNTMKLFFIILLFILVFVSYRFILYYFKFKIFEHLSSGTVQLGTRGVFALILVFVVVSESMGVKSILGAFLAGVIVSLLAPSKGFMRQLDSFGYGFFIPIFFVMVGVEIDLWSLFADASMFVLIPVLFVMLYVSKMIPILYLRKWFSFHETIGAGVLLTSTLSLVVAAAAIALEMGLISENMNGALVLVAVMTCLLSPVVFNRWVPKTEEKPTRVTIIGANKLTLPVSIDFEQDGYDVKLFGRAQSKVALTVTAEQVDFPLIELDSITEQKLEEYDAFDTDFLILGTSYDELNIQLAHYAREKGIKNIIIHVEEPKHHAALTKEGYTVFSTLFASRTLLKTLVLQPKVGRLTSQHHNWVREIVVTNMNYNDLPIRRLPFVGDALILYIIRDETYLVPDGDTPLKVGDRLLISGQKDNVKRMRKELEA